jgi:hypothetical protein
MNKLFDVDGPNLDRGFENLKAAESRFEQQLHDRIEAMWATYDGRFWEMYLGCTLLEAGRTLLPVVDRQRQGGQPDLCVLDGQKNGSNGS